MPAGRHNLDRHAGPGRVLVRCLGPGPEHAFLSRDPARHRVCAACRARLQVAALPRPGRVVAVGDGD